METVNDSESIGKPNAGEQKIRKGQVNCVSSILSTIKAMKQNYEMKFVIKILIYFYCE